MVALSYDHSAWGGHLVLLHDGETQRAEAIGRWATDTLVSGEKLVYMEPDGGPGFAALLRDAGVDVAAARSDGRVEVVAPEAFYARGAVGQLVDRALTEGFPAVRISGESRFALGVLAWQDHQGFERRMTRMSERLPLHFLCQYGVRDLDEEQLEETVAAHLPGVRRERFGTHDAGDGLLRLSGELDRQNARTLAAVVAAAASGSAAAGEGPLPGLGLPGPTVLALDLEGVTFLDVAGARTLVEATEAFRRGGGRVLLVSPPSQVERVLRLMDVDVVPGLDIVGDE